MSCPAVARAKMKPETQRVADEALRVYFGWESDDVLREFLRAIDYVDQAAAFLTPEGQARKNFLFAQDQQEKERKKRRK